ncbi:MAG: hypothetical protein Q8L06_17240, partial [Pseudohongiella sp.]|nr:hypothetical protein [Pseudohongiella sp.]
MTIFNALFDNSFTRLLASGLMAGLIALSGSQALAQDSTGEMQVISETIEAGIKETRFDLV